MYVDSMSWDERWRVVVFTNLPNGVVYHLAEEVLRPLGHRIVGVVTTPGPRRNRSTDYLGVVAAVPPGIDIIVSSHPDRLANMLAPLRPDLILCGGFPWLIPQQVIDLPRLGAINMHPSLLPRHRGPRAIEWAFRNGDSEMGFTIHRLDRAFDTGSILAQTGVPIADEDDAESMLRKFPAITPGLLNQALERIARGESGEPQDASKATYAGPFEDEWRRIDWARPARSIHNQVRSWTGFRGMPAGAIADIDGSSIAVIKTRLVHDEMHHGSPGTILRRDGERMVVQCGDSPIEVVSWVHHGDKPGVGHAHPVSA